MAFRLTFQHNEVNILYSAVCCVAIIKISGNPNSIELMEVRIRSVMVNIFTADVLTYSLDRLIQRRRLSGRAVGWLKNASGN